MVEPLIKMDHVYKIYEVRKLLAKNYIVAVEDFNLSIEYENPSIVTLAGESGCGKTTVARMILGLVEPTRGIIYYRGKDLRRLKGMDLVMFRRDVQAVFQDPYASFNPLHRIETILVTPIKKLGISNSDREAIEIAERSLEEVGLNPSAIMGKYPRQLSGGERQRVMIARALSLNPKLIVADEPVSMLDASIRANILNLIKDLKDRRNISFVYITHDLSTAYYISDEIIIMYRGSIVEKGIAKKVLLEPLHPYTKILIESIPIPDPTKKKNVRGTWLYEDATSSIISTGCKFYPRCPVRMEKCLSKHPPLIRINDREVACYLYGSEKG